MPPQQTVQNNFKLGLKTEFTGLNFPENAATDTQNCVFSLIGDVTRRGGINYESNFILNPIGQASVAKSSFKWLNAGGDGQSQILVQQIGFNLYFYLSSAAIIANPLSHQLMGGSAISLNSFVATGNTADPSQTECQYTSGNGYLFVFHPNCDPFFCTFFPGTQTITAQAITLSTRDFTGILEPGVPDNFRPNTLSIEHQYNLQNQGWTQGTQWSATGNSNPALQGVPQIGQTWTIPISSQSNTTTVVAGDEIAVFVPTAAGTGANPHVNGSVTVNGQVIAGSYAAPFTQISILVTANSNPALNTFGVWSGATFQLTVPETVQLSLVNVGFITAWNAALGNYPSNSDIWWLYKNSLDAFSPGTTFANVQQQQTLAPRGSFTFNPFNQDRSFASQIPGLTPVSTTQRPATGTFYQGRMFYAGVNSSQTARGDEPFYTWTENIYFSQIIVDTSSFGKCFQQNDPTSQTLNALLPSDGGQIVIQGCGAVYKLFALRFGILVFAANGIWFISGSTGIGFTATDYTVTKISSIRAISGASFIDVQGYPMFWNQEGIYHVTPSQQPGSAHSPDIQLTVQNLTLGTILTYYDNIPISSKYYARGDYDELNYVVQWCFRSIPETSIFDRYNYNTILSYNIVTQAFYPYTLPVTNNRSTVNDIKYIISPGGTNAPLPVFKYITTHNITLGVTFSEENDFTNWVDFLSEASFHGSNFAGYPYTSYFITGYTLPGQALRKIQMPYVYMFSRNPGPNSYSIQAIWDYAGAGLGTTDELSGKWSTRQTITNNQTDFTMVYRKIRLRGRGMAVQIRISSIPGQPFDLMGWSVLDQVNQVV